jgi:UDP-N-acetylmuramoyl-L-alanyl-D-glutamate--2,6-diaminopimelate ligase
VNIGGGQANVREITGNKSMRLNMLTADLNLKSQTGNGDPEIRGIKMDSRKVVPGDLFVAIPGFKDNGSRFIADALKKGAAAVVTEQAGGTEKANVPVVLVNDARIALALIAGALYKHPDMQLQVTGITGTNGKTTTAHLTNAVLEAAGRRSSLLGTISHTILGRTIDAQNTTPEATDLFAFFRETADGNGDSVVMEVSSHALALNRVYGIKFDTAVFTNLTHDHLDFHKNVDDYFAAKSILFLKNLKKNGTAVINMDDPYGKKLCTLMKKERNDCILLTYGSSNDASIYPKTCRIDWKGIALTLHTPSGELVIDSPLSGNFNVSNLMAATAAGLAHGIDQSEILSALRSFHNVPGRFESMRLGQACAIVIDYAHTPDALERVLISARSLTRGKVIVVFGCGGDRDRTKRPVMGAIATRLADTIIVTSDNPRTEDPQSIIKEILAGIRDNSSVEIEPDRKKAIEMALASADAQDCVVIAGKGHETYQILGTVKHHFDDHEVVRSFYAA